MTDAPGTDAGPYLVGLDLRDKPVVIVGGGSVAGRRIGALLAAGAEITVIAPQVRPAIEALADAHRIEVLARPYEPGDLADAWYVLAATDDPVVNEAVAAEAFMDRTFCVRADLAVAGTAVTPATGRTDGLTVGVLAAGDHRRSAAMRDALLEVLDTGAVDSALEPPAAGVALVGGGPGDPDLITVRGRRLLARADVVVADRLAPAELLSELRPNVEVIDAAKIPYGRQMRQEAINETLIDRARAGKFVVRLKGGDPFVYGRGFEEVQALTAAGIPVTVVPGITSAIAAPAAAGIPVTHRGITHEFVVVSGHVAPDDPSSLVDWAALGRLHGTIVLLMGVERIAAFADALIAGGRAPATPVAVVENGTLADQRTTRTDLGSVADAVREHGIRPPAVIVIGPVAGISASDQ